MATLSQTTGTGHNPRKERKVAGMLYMAISAVVVAAFLYFVFMSRSNEVSPTPVPNQQGAPNSDAVAPPGAPPSMNQ